jgi:hypothetical protein
LQQSIECIFTTVWDIALAFTPWMMATFSPELIPSWFVLAGLPLLLCRYELNRLKLLL